MIDFQAFNALVNLDVGEFVPKPTSLTENQQEAAVPLWTSDDGLIEIGVWECTPGTFTADRSKSSEFCHILSGSATLKNVDGSGERSVAAGDLLVLPLGWRGEWTVHASVKKTYILQHPPAGTTTRTEA